jgi:hypothetical protein
MGIITRKYKEYTSKHKRHTNPINKYGVNWTQISPKKYKWLIIKWASVQQTVHKGNTNQKYIIPSHSSECVSSRTQDVKKVGEDTGKTRKLYTL